MNLTFLLLSRNTWFKVYKSICSRIQSLIQKQRNNSRLIMKCCKKWQKIQRWEYLELISHNKLSVTSLWKNMFKFHTQFSILMTWKKVWWRDLLCRVFNKYYLKMKYGFESKYKRKISTLTVHTTKWLPLRKMTKMLLQIRLKTYSIF